MREIRGRLGLATEPLHEQRIGAQLGVENLEGNRTVQQQVLRTVNHRHPAASNQVRDLVPI